MALIGRELVEAVNELIRLKIDRNIIGDKGGLYSDTVRVMDEKIEVTNRAITDAFLAMDARKGVYVEGGKLG